MTNVITNGLLLTEDVVDRLIPFGLNGIKVTLDGDRDTHNRMRPLRGGQGTFDRIIENIRRVADRCNISIGGNFDESSVDSYPALLDFLQRAGLRRQAHQRSSSSRLSEIPSLPDERRPSRSLQWASMVSPSKPLGGTCMTSAGSGGASACDTCQFLDDKMSFLREETRRHGFKTGDGVHVGPCHVHMDNARTIGPDGSLYPCPGFTGEKAQSIGPHRRSP